MQILNQEVNFALTCKSFLARQMADKDINLCEKELLISECLLSDSDKQDLAKIALKSIGVE